MDDEINPFFLGGEMINHKKAALHHPWGLTPKRFFGGKDRENCGIGQAGTGDGQRKNG
jgi:hypothetical protein